MRSEGPRGCSRPESPTPTSCHAIKGSQGRPSAQPERLGPAGCNVILDSGPRVLVEKENAFLLPRAETTARPDSATSVPLGGRAGLAHLGHVPWEVGGQAGGNPALRYEAWGCSHTQSDRFKPVRDQGSNPRRIGPAGTRPSDPGGSVCLAAPAAPGRAGMPAWRSDHGTPRPRRAL